MFNFAELYQNLYDIVDIIVNYYYNTFNHIELAICWQEQKYRCVDFPKPTQIAAHGEGGVQVQTRLGVVRGK
jgi:hypothetical protein